MFIQFLFLSFLIFVENRMVEIKCPKLCKCDQFESLRRATCTKRNLASIESNFPAQTELLDLSYNQIITLTDYVFKRDNLLDLKLLNISHNKVKDIGLRAFEGLNSLKTLDLSFNSITYIQELWFTHLAALQELYLKGNSFGKLEIGPVIHSKTLRKLDLSSSHIFYITAEYFGELPELEYLDLSENDLVHVNLRLVDHLPKLNFLDVNITSLSCDGRFHDLSNYCKKQGIRLINRCDKRIIDSDEKFQRMVVAEKVDEKNSWLYEDHEEINESRPLACNNTRDDKKNLLQEIVDLSPALSIVIPFFYGVSIGILIAYLYALWHDHQEGKLTAKSNTYINYEDIADPYFVSNRNRWSYLSFKRNKPDEDSQGFAMDEYVPESTPMTVRRNF